MPRIAFLHTVAGLAPTFAELAKTHLPGADIFHVVDESLLQNTIREGALTTATMRRVAAHLGTAADAGAEAILVTCSSIGAAVDAARPFCPVPLVRVDEGLALAAIDAGRRIGVLATLRTTLEPTQEIIRRCATEAGHSPDLTARLCDGAFERLTAGDAEAHDRIVAQELESLAAGVDVVVLAQASMARVAGAMREGAVKVPVLSSPELGTKHFASAVAEAGL